MTKVLIFYDTETTGRSYKSDRIVQFAATTVYNGVKLFDFSSFVCPESGGLRRPRAMSAGASRVTGIVDKHLISKPPFGVIWRRFIKEFYENTKAIKYDEIVFVGYNNYAFDDRILCLELRRNGNILEESFRVKDDKILSLDVLQQVRRILSPKTKDKKACILPNNKLGTVYEYVTKVPLSNAHEALSDVHATIKVYEYIISLEKELAACTFSHVVNLIPQPLEVSVTFNTAKFCKMCGKNTHDTQYDAIPTVKSQMTCKMCRAVYSKYFKHVCDSST